MLKKLNKYIQQKIQASYNKSADISERTYEDAAFMTLLDVVYNVTMIFFCIFSAISIFLFTKMEILPFISQLIS
jgi:hypothetical protein